MDARASLLSTVDRLALLLGLPPLARELLALLSETGRLVRGALQLRLLGHDGLLLLVVLGASAAIALDACAMVASSPADFLREARASASRSDGDPAHAAP